MRDPAVAMSIDAHAPLTLSAPRQKSNVRQRWRTVGDKVVDVGVDTHARRSKDARRQEGDPQRKHEALHRGPDIAACKAAHGARAQPLARHADAARAAARARVLPAARRDAAEDVIPAGVLAPRVNHEDRGKERDLQQQVKEQAERGKDGERGEGGQRRVAADDECGKVGDRRDRDRDAGAAHGGRHALRQWRARVSLVHGRLEHKHAVDANADHDERQDGHEGREDEAQVAAEAVRRDDGQANVQQPCTGTRTRMSPDTVCPRSDHHRRMLRRQPRRFRSVRQVWQPAHAVPKWGSTPPMVSAIREPTQPSLQSEMAETV